MPGRSKAVISLQTKQHAGGRANKVVIAINNETDNGARNYDSHHPNENHALSSHAAVVCE